MHSSVTSFDPDLSSCSERAVKAPAKSASPRTWLLHVLAALGIASADQAPTCERLCHRVDREDGLTHREQPGD